MDSRVPLKILVQHGMVKTFLVTELEDQDIVLTTYGTLSSEYKEDHADCGPLIKVLSNFNKKVSYQITQLTCWLASKLYQSS